MNYLYDNIFRKIIDNGKNFIYEDDHTVVIEDKYPKEKIHLLVLTKKNIATLYDAHDTDIMFHMMCTVYKVVKMYSIEDNFRIIINNGMNAGQEIYHLHIHILSSGKLV